MRSFQSIHHPTDLSQGSHKAFEHALRLAANGKTKLRLLHVGKDSTPPWSEFPGIRLTLEHWGELPKGSTKSDVLEFGIKPYKFFMKTQKAIDAINNDICREDPDLVVMAARSLDGISRLLHRSVCQAVIRESKKATLLLPADSRGFVDSETGVLSLRRMLIPVSPEVRPGIAAKLARRIVATLTCKAVEARLFFVGKEAEMPALDLADNEFIRWNSKTREGDVLEAIDQEVQDYKPDLMVMVDRGRDSVLDHLLPGKLQKAVAKFHLPLLTQNIQT